MGIKFGETLTIVMRQPTLCFDIPNRFSSVNCKVFVIPGCETDPEDTYAILDHLRPHFAGLDRARLNLKGADNFEVDGFLFYDDPLIEQAAAANQQ